MRIDKIASAGLVAMVAVSVNLPANAQNQAMIENNLNTGLQQYQTTIQTGINAGQITPAEAQSLQNELNRIHNMRAAFAQGGYDQNEVNTLLNTFSNYNNMISQLSQNGVNSTIAGNGGYWGGNYGGPYTGNYANVPNSSWNTGYNFNYDINNYDQFSSFRGNVGTRIDRAAARGVITPNEALSMRAEFNDITARMNRRSMNGNLRNNNLVNRLSSLDRRLNATIAARRGTQWF